MTHIYLAIWDHEYDVAFKVFESSADAKVQLELWAKESAKGYGWIIDDVCFTSIAKKDFKKAVESINFKAAVKNWDEITEGSEKLLIKRLKVN